MKDVEFDLIGIRVLDQKTGERVFKQDQFVAVIGQERDSLTIEEQAQEYYHPFDLEVGNRFMKGAERLFLAFESEVYQPKKCKKGVGREKGATQEKRLRYRVVKKGKGALEMAKPRVQREWKLKKTGKKKEKPAQKRGQVRANFVQSLSIHK